MGQEKANCNKNVFVRWVDFKRKQIGLIIFDELFDVLLDAVIVFEIVDGVLSCPRIVNAERRPLRVPAKSVHYKFNLQIISINNF